MGKLEDILSTKIDSRKLMEAIERAPSTEFLSLARDLDTLKETVREVISEVRGLRGKELVTDTRELTMRFERIERGMERMVKMLEPKEVNLDPVAAAVDGLAGKVDGYIEAVNSIKLPDVNIPEFPEISIPEYKETDISPLIAQGEALQNAIEALTEAVAKEPESPEWIFDIDRFGNQGLIKSVTARQAN